MRVVVTGVAGLIGSWWAQALVEAGDEVRSIDNLSGGDLASIPCGVPLSNIDCGDREGVLAFLKDFRPEVVVHCAALPYEGLSVFSPSLVFNNVAGASVSLFSAAIAAGVRKIVFCSSMARYGRQPMAYGPDRNGRGVHGFNEAQPTRPCDPYGIAKVAAEDVLKALGEAHGIEWSVVVPHNVYGPRQRYWDPYRNVVGIFLNGMLQGAAPPIFSDGAQTRCFTYVEDLLPLFVPLTRKTYSVLNVGPDDGTVTINALWRLCAEVTGFWGEPRYLPARPLEVPDASCLAAKARALFGWEPKTSLREGVEKYAAWIRERGPRPFERHLTVELPWAPAHWLQEEKGDG